MRYFGLFLFRRFVYRVKMELRFVFLFMFINTCFTLSRLYRVRCILKCHVIVLLDKSLMTIIGIAQNCGVHERVKRFKVVEQIRYMHTTSRSLEKRLNIYVIFVRAGKVPRL